MKIVEIILLICLGIAAWQDLKCMYVKAWIFYLAGLIALIGKLLFCEMESIEIWIVGVLPGLFLLLMTWLSRKQIGVGDGFAVLILGIWVGAGRTFALFFIANIVCAFFCGSLLVLKRVNKKTEVPFLPFLFLVCLVGAAVR